MNKNVVVVYGSGASFASGYTVKLKDVPGGGSIKPPMDREFFTWIPDDWLEKQKYYALLQFKKLVFGDVANVGMEEVWTTLDLNHKHITLDTYDWQPETNEYTNTTFENQYPSMDLLPNQVSSNYFSTEPEPNKFKFLGDCGRDFRRLLYDVYSNFDRPVPKNYLKLLHEKLTSSGNVLLGYITFNYDCYLEDALDGFSYVNANSNTASLDKLTYNSLPVIKLHGSLNWSHVPNRPPIQNGPPFKKDDQIVPKYTNVDEWCEPAIIPPTAFKQDINDDLRVHSPLVQTILQQWRASMTILRDASKVIFVGYSFPPTDFHAKRIFQISVMRSREPKMVLDCVGPNTADKKDDFLTRMFRNDSVVTVHGLDKLIEGDKLDEFLAS